MISGEIKFAAILFGLDKTLRFMARRHPEFAKRLAERNLKAQIRTGDGRVGRLYVLEGGRITISGTAESLARDDRVREAYLGV